MKRPFTISLWNILKGRTCYLRMWERGLKRRREMRRGYRGNRERNVDGRRAGARVYRAAATL